MTPTAEFRMAVAPALGLLFLAALGGCSTPPAPTWQAPAATAFTHPLTLDECLRLAHASDVRAVAWQARLDGARAAITAAGAVPNPALGLTWEGVGLKSAEGQSLQSHALSGSYPLLFWWPRSAKLAAARAGERAEAAGVRSEERQLAAQVGGAFFGLVAGQRRVRIARELEENAREALRLTTKGRDLGLRSAYEVDRAQTELLQAQAESADAASTLRLDRLAFAFALGADRPAFPEVVEDGDAAGLGDDAGAGPEGLPDDLLAAALHADPDWAKAVALREAAEAQLAVEQRSLLPLADAQASGGAKQEADGLGKLFSLDIPIPLLNWNGGGIQRAAAAVRAAQADEEKARRAVISSLAADWERVRAAVVKWRRFARPLSEQRERLAASAQRLFTAGQLGYADLLTARRDLQQAQQSETDAWRDAAAASWTLACALGRHDPGPAAPPPAAPGKEADAPPAR